MIPEFNEDGNLPEGIHLTGEEELLSRFGSGSARRRWLGERLRDLLALAKSTGALDRFFVWGSFVSAKESPNDLDLLLLMSASFDLEDVPPEAMCLFDHTEARLAFHANIFWSRSSIDQAVLKLWLDTYQMTRDFKRRGIVEVDLR